MNRFFLAVLFTLLIPVCIFADKDLDLLNAAENGMSENVVELVESGANVNVTDALGNTPLTLAMKKGHVEIALLLQEKGATITAVLNDSGVRMRNRPTTSGSNTVGSLDKGDSVIILGKSRTAEKIQDMSAHWLKVQTQDGVIGYSYGYFFDVDPLAMKAVPTLYENYQYGFKINFPMTWDGWSASEQLINFGYGVEAPVIYFGLPEQKEIFAVSVYTQAQWDKLVNAEPPDNLEGDPYAENSNYLINYSLGHYAANDEMHQRRKEVASIMKTIVVID